ncbi:OLC1v1025811C2 [Oldenlandia corymbosa var. corymbosa]|nr:OLC1v1025811C2 [Oldenlandia corymbosa var. corymbosa]
MKRKTELGGALSIASWMLFIGLFAALLYQIISKRSVEVHNIRASNAPDLAAFLNDLEFNITAISGMSCSNLRGLGTLVSGNPGTIDYKVAPLSTFTNFSCQNTSRGPTITLKCINCPLIPDIAYIPWQFVDLPNDPATAVGFDFKLSAKSHDDDKHLSSVAGTIKNGTIGQSKRVTFRGTEPNIFKFNLFPRHYRNVHDLKLIQPLFHDFIPGSSFSDVDQLRASLESSSDGLLNMTLYVNFLSDYIVEIDSQNVLGPVSFLADMGGLYCFSVCIFFYLLLQCEYRSKKLRQEDVVMRNVRNRRKAQERWDKLRKYVMYTWGCSSLDDNKTNDKKEACCAGLTVNSWHKSRPSHRPKRQKTLEMLSFNRNVKQPCEKQTVPDINQAQMSNCSMKPSSAPKSTNTTHEPENGVPRKVRVGNPGATSGSLVGEVSQTDMLPVQEDLTFPPPPVLQCGTSGEANITDLQKSIQNLYDYNVMLRDKLAATQSMLHALSQNKLSPFPESGPR